MLEPTGPNRPGRDGVHVTAELAGLVLANQPVPWNAEAVLVEAMLRLPPTARRKEDFTIALPHSAPVQAESVRPEATGDRYRVFFRLPPPASDISAQMQFRGRPLAPVTITTLSRSQFLASLTLLLPAVHARLGAESVACQTFVASQCAGLHAAAVLTAPTSLAPISELGLKAQVHGADRSLLAEVAVPLTAAQLASRQALLAAHPRKLPRRSGEWSITWQAGERDLAVSRARAIPPSVFYRSLRVVGTRFVVANEAGLTLTRQAPTTPGVRVGPCFLVGSTEPGMAARATFHIKMLGRGGSAEPLAVEALVTDGPTLVTPGTVPFEQLTAVDGFELRHRGKALGMLPLRPVPTAAFTAEGGFTPPSDFTWSPAADEELSDRLAKLMGG